MKVISKQHNSKMCAVCGLDNKFGLRAPFYNMENGSVASLFTYRDEHQSYPGRVHGGLISSMIDELGVRALWAKKLDESVFGVTLRLEVKFRKPVPYNTLLLAYGYITKETGKAFDISAGIYTLDGVCLANGTMTYLKLDVAKISEGVHEKEEMPYLIEDGVTEIAIPENVLK